jgi:signal transduction histidine kinase
MSNYNILLLDDDLDDHLLIEEYIEEIPYAHYHLECVTDYKQAEKLFENETYDCFLIDNYLGAKSGLELINEAKLKGNEKPFILLTGLDSREVDIKAIQAGASDYIPKAQLSASVLERSIRHSITRYQQNLLIKSANKRAAQLEKLSITGKLAKLLGHEVRNPLTNIMLASQHLLDEASEDDKMYIEMILRNSNRINELIDLLLNNTSSAKVELKRTKVAEVVNKAIETCTDRIKLKGIHLELDFDKEIEHQIDEKNLSIAIVNIITNAIEAMNETPEPSLKISVGRKDLPVISIVDNGKGMDEETKNSIFDPFFTKREGGLGLGMANTLKIVSQHNAEIQVVSELGKGTEFHILLR